jgi:hypothetical protein
MEVKRTVQRPLWQTALGAPRGARHMGGSGQEDSGTLVQDF